MSSFKAECRKFQPNIFNKTKCSNCFRQRDEHSAAALESNRATRKVSKCGYLFVSPDWDFSIPLNRTKRWQRRWFVLYDDGELTYSVDDLPATIPQGVINMTRVLEVTKAEDVTGNEFALAITCPDRATFVKGTCREESRWWLDVLSVFPRQHGRHKRNATFPGIKSSSALLQTRSALAKTPPTPALATSFDSPSQRNRFDSLIVGRPSSAPTLGGRQDVFPSTAQTPMFHSTPVRVIRVEQKENTPPYIEDYDDHPPTSESPPTQDKVLGHRPRGRKTNKRGHPRIDPLIITEMETKREEKLKDIADSITRPRGSSGFIHKEIKPTRESDHLEKNSSENIRGDPDGCGLESDHHLFSPVSDLQRVDLPAEEVLYIKKGWLLKQGLTKEWSKHWFVLLGSGLRFYRDPSAEDNGILDGIIDLGMVKNIQERDVGRNYGFTITTWEDKKYIFSAVTLGIRSNWIQALRNAANLKESTDRSSSYGDKIDQEIFSKDTIDSSYRNSNLSRSFVSSDEDFKTASDASFFKVELEDLTNYDDSSEKSSITPRSQSSPPSSRRGTKDDILTFNNRPEKDFNSGEAMLVDLLETQVESLKAKLEQTQYGSLQKTVSDQQRDIKEKNYLINKLEALKVQMEKEKTEWQDKILVEQKKESNYLQQGDTVRKLTRSLQETEVKLKKFHSEDNSERLLIENLKLKTCVSTLTAEMEKLKDGLKSEKSEVYKWKDLVKELRSLLDGRNGSMEIEIETLREKVKLTQSDLDKTADRLYRGIEENEILCNKIRDLERIEKLQVRRGSSSLSISSSRFSSRKSLPRLDSLSDLTNVDFTLDPEELDRDRLIDEFTDVRLRFEKAVSEIRALKRETKEIQAQQDDLEFQNQRLRDAIKLDDEEKSSEINLMSTRIQDLTNKFTNSEKQLRNCKLKMNRAESRERRRTQSLKGRESFTLSRDMEVKLSQLETRVDSILGDSLTEEVVPKSAKRSRSFEEATKSSRLRRKSLDSQTDAMKAIVRINDIESKVAVMSGEDLRKTMETSSNNSSLNSVVLSTPRSKSPQSNNSPLRSPASSRKATRSPRLSVDKLPKLSRSESEPKILREKLCALEKILNSLQSKLTECATLSNVIECTCSCSSSALSSLQQILSSAARAAQYRHVSQMALTRMEPLTSKLHHLLKEKMSQLMEKRQQCRTAGTWNREAQLKNFAERLAYETLILSQLAQMQQATHRPQTYEASVRLQELVEAHRKLSFLEKRLTNPDFDMEPSTPVDFYTSLLAEKLVVEGDVIQALNPIKGKSGSSNGNDETCKELREKVLDRERSLARLVSQYKREKLREMAVVMARETVTGSSHHPQTTDDLPEELRLRQAWTMAQEMVAQELVNLEASQSLLRLSHILGGSDNNASIITHISSSSVERLHSGAEESLRQEMEESAFTLSSQYEEILARHRAGDKTLIYSVNSSIEDVLLEFAKIVSQKALVDGQLAVATANFDNLPSNSAVIVDPLDAATDVVASEAHLLMFLGGGDPETEAKVNVAMDQAEFAFVYNDRGASCVANLEDLKIREDLATKTSSSSPKTRRRSSAGDPNRKSRRVSDITGMIVADGCRQCDELRQELMRLRRSVESKKSAIKNECGDCIEHLKTIEHLENEHRKAMEIKFEPPTRDSDDELTKLKRRLCLLEENYEERIAALKKQYQDSEDDNIKQRYQKEIENLRELCENGLNSMENSYRRLLQETEEKHRRETRELRAEKEEALAEETRATLSALDAMRKAHEAEVQKEVAKFKEDCLLRRSTNKDGGVGSSHLEEVREVRREILVLSEKYSGKCLEVATKEHQMESLRKRLSEAKLHSKDLNARNQQLKTRLTSQVVLLQNEDPKSASHWKKLHESQITLKNEEIARLNNLLERSNTTMADEVCDKEKVNRIRRF